MGDIGGAGLLGLLALLQVIVPVGQAQAALVRLGDHLGRVAEILVGAEAEQHVDTDQVQAGDERGQILLVGHGGDAVELGLQRLGALRLDAASSMQAVQ
jgi:hypothetical protein